MSSFFGGIGEPQDAKLSEQEQKLVARLLSDPTYFPLEFRTWLKNYIEGAGITVDDLAGARQRSATSRTGLPAGLIIICGSLSSVPPDAKVCDGLELSARDREPALRRDRGHLGAGERLHHLQRARPPRPHPLRGRLGDQLGRTDGVAFGSRSGWRHQPHGYRHGSLPIVKNVSAAGLGLSERRRRRNATTRH